MRLLLGLVVAAGCAAWLVWSRRRGNWGVIPAALIVICLLYSGNEWRWSHFEAGLTTAARPVLDDGRYPLPKQHNRFGCERLMRNFWSSQGFAGHVWFDASGRPVETAFLGMDTCSGIKRFRAAPARAGIPEIQAAHILAHEAAHLTGVRSEAQAECLAMTHDAQVMERLGASTVVAEQDAARYRRDIYPQLPEAYRGAC